MGMPISRLAKIMLAVIVLLLLLMMDSGILNSAKNAVGGLFNVTYQVGGKDIQGAKPTLHPEHEKAIDSLYATLEKLAKSSDTQCVGKYNGFQKMDNTNIVITSNENQDKIFMRVKAGEGGVQDAKVYPPIDGSLCVIGGEIDGEDVADEFYNRWLKPDGLTTHKYVNKINGIQINGNKKAFFLNIKSELNDGGWLYKDEKEVCLFPTSTSFLYGPYANNKEGLNDIYLQADSKNKRSIAFALETRRLTLCS